MHKKLNGETDAHLWKLVREYNEAAFAVLYQRYWSPVFTTAYSYLKDKDACASIVHDIFISVWQRKHQLEIISFQHYLTNAARYRVYKHLQAEKKRTIIYAGVREDSLSSSSLNIVEDKFRKEYVERKLDVHLSALPKRCREIFILSRKEYLTNDEIAGHLKISKRTVENQLTYALKHLRLALEDLLIIIVAISIMKILQ